MGRRATYDEQLELPKKCIHQVSDLEILHSFPHSPLLFEIYPSRAQFLHQRLIFLFRWLGETLCKTMNKHNSEEQEKYFRSCQSGRKAQQDNKFLKGTEVAYMIYDYFKISGTGEGLLDSDDLSRVQLKDDNVQGFDTKRDDVLLFHILEIVRHTAPVL